MDFYRPARLTTLFSEVFSGEHFHPVSSPQRVYKQISLLKSYLRRHHIPLKVKSLAQGWELRAAPEAELAPRVRLHRDAHGNLALPNRLDFACDELRACFAPGAELTRADVQKWLKVSARQGNLLLQEAVNRGWVDRVGERRATRYHWVAVLPPKAF